MDRLTAQWDIVKQDLRSAARLFSRARGFALTIVLVTAVGVGANTAAFSVADFVLLRPLAFPDADRLVRICEGPRRDAGWGCMNELSPANYRDLKTMSTSFEAMGAFVNGTANLAGGGEPRRLAIARFTSDVLPILGVRPALGRVFAAGEGEDLDAAVISHGLWQSQFGGREEIVGEKVNLDGAPHTVVGVMPASFIFPSREAQIWTKLSFSAEDLESRTNTYVHGVARLRPQVTFEQARSELWTIVDRLGREHPETNAETGVSFFRMRDGMSPRYGLMLMTLSGASLCLLLLMCANLGSLLLARAITQERELAVRAALGAGRERLVRQLITQTVLLTLVGGAVGLGIAYFAVPLFSTLVPPTLPLATQPGLDLRLLGVAAVFTIVTALGFGVLPALRAGRTGFAALREGGRSGTGANRRGRSALVTLEVAISAALLIVSGLLLRAAWRVQAIEPGFVAGQALTLRTALPRPKYQSPTQRGPYFDRVLADVRALPGVASAAFTSGLPMIVTGLVTGIDVPGRESAGTRGDGAVSHRWVTPQYFQAMGIPLLRGRDVADTDTREQPFVAVVSQSLVEQYWPGQDPLGKTFGHRGDNRVIVGVVGDVKVRGLERSSEPQIYLPAAQIADGSPSNFDPKDLVIRHSGPEGALAPAVRRIVHAADPDQPISDVRTLEAVLQGDTAARRAQLSVLGALASVAVLLAGVGVYGLLAYTVSQRSREIGVRLALGAEPASVGRMIVKDGLRLAAIGLLPGAALAYFAARGMDAILFGITPADPLAFGAGMGVAFAMTFAGSIIPAFRAVRLSPMVVLRAD